MNKVKLLIWEGQLTLSQTSPGFMCLHLKSFETTGKGEVARNEQFFLFQRIFYPFGWIFWHFHQTEIVVCNFFQYAWDYLKFDVW